MDERTEAIEKPICLYRWRVRILTYVLPILCPSSNCVLSSFRAEREWSQEYEWLMTDSRKLRPGKLKWKQGKDMLGQLTSELTSHSEICREDIPELANKRVCDTPIFHRRSFVRDGIPQQIKLIIRGNITQWTTRDDQPHRRYSWHYFQSWSRNLFVATFHSRLQRALFSWLCLTTCQQICSWQSYTADQQMSSWKYSTVGQETCLWQYCTVGHKMNLFVIIFQSRSINLFVTVFHSGRRRD